MVFSSARPVVLGLGLSAPVLSECVGGSMVETLFPSPLSAPPVFLGKPLAGLLFGWPVVEEQIGKVTFEEEEHSVHPVRIFDGSGLSLAGSDSTTLKKTMGSLAGANSVALIHINLVSPAVCGKVIGTSGKFCLTLQAGCPTKSHTKAPSGWQHALNQGLKLALLIQALTMPSGPTTAFQIPFLDATKLSLLKFQELLSISKPVLLWGGMFTLLEAKPSEDSTMDDYNEEFGMSNDGHQLIGAAPFASSHKQDQFIPKLERKYAKATTPAKRQLPPKQVDAMMSPPMVVLKDMGIDASGEEF
ncbi:hypothetical protein ACA910_007925 [Epithemia clementina (nom. ined.)]